MSFEQLNLAKPILTALSACGYTAPTPIQLQAIPVSIAGKDLIATSQTGTGKTAAFVLPALQRLTTFKKSPLPKILVLTPTRELATQIAAAVNDYGKHLQVKTVSILGGMPYHTQLRQLRKPSDMIIATPGRLMDHMERGKIDLSEIEILILDEADRMLDMGFYEDVEFIAAKLPASRQTLLFTATLDKQLENLAKKLLHDPIRIEIASKKVTLDNIKQQIYMANNTEHKMAMLHTILSEGSVDKAIIFAATKRAADELAEELQDSGHEVGALHGDMNQRKRNRTLQQMRAGKIRLLVATDVASRGIDIDDVTHVINYDLPRTGEDYVHRIGRTGRVGRAGTAISFAKKNDLSILKRIEQFTQQKIEKKGATFKEESREPFTKKKSYNSKRPTSKRFEAKPKRTFTRDNQKPHRDFTKKESDSRRFTGARDQDKQWGVSAPDNRRGKTEKRVFTKSFSPTTSFSKKSKPSFSKSDKKPFDKHPHSGNSTRDGNRSRSTDSARGSRSYNSDNTRGNNRSRSSDNSVRGRRSYSSDNARGSSRSRREFESR